MNQDSTYDSIIIGSGLGGLSTASFLARNGKKVLILERHTVPGGFTHTFKRKGYEWDVGVHYVGQMSNESKSLMRQVFDYVTDSQLKWTDMGTVYDQVIIEEKTFDFVKGIKNQQAKLIEYFPGEEKNIGRYFKLIKSLGLSSGLFFGEKSMPWFLSRTLGFFMRFRFLKWARKTTYQVLSEIFDNERLISVLCAQCGDYGLPPKKSSFAIHAGLVDHYLNGGSYPVGGARSIYENIIDGIKKRGGQIKLGQEVVQILVEKNRAVGVQTKNGQKYFSNSVVSDVGARNTFGKLWPRAITLPQNIKKELSEIRPSVAHICLYVGLKASDSKLDLPKNNVWIYDSFDFDRKFESLSEDDSTSASLFYISFPSAKDLTWNSRYPNKSTIQVIAPCPFSWVEKWQDKPWLKRGDDYLEFKAHWQRVLLEKLFCTFPQVKDHVEHCEISTPLTTKHFSNHQRGEIYGLEHTPTRMRVKWLRAHTPIKNLFLTGQDVVMVGVGGALFSGVITAVAILRKNVLWPILRNSKSD